MDRTAVYGLMIVLGLGVAGCGGGGASDATATAQNQTPKPVQSPPPSDPAARVAYDFLLAVLKADEQKVSACLTPKAVDSLVKSNQRFVLPGVDSTTFTIGEVRKPPDPQMPVLVQCVLNDSSKPEQTQKDEICCFVRQIDTDWRVSGVAFSPGPGQPPMIIDFESGPGEPMGLPVAPQASTEQQGPVLPQRPSPARTAEDTQPPAFR